VQANSIEELLKQSDFVTLHVPCSTSRGTDRRQTSGGHEERRGALNFARDGIVDETR
jgi:phosphoglycerate dehydrogenase-like enzyme